MSFKYAIFYHFILSELNLHGIMNSGVIGDTCNTSLEDLF